jgi:quinol monooxygenase YgiN
MIRVVAILTTKPGKRGELLEAFAAIRPAVLAEKGCHEYGANFDHPEAGPGRAQFGPDTAVIIESWETLEDLAAHGAAPHMRDLGRRIKDIIEARAVHVLNPA